MVEARWQAEAAVDDNLEGHAVLALDAVVSVGEIVVRSLNRQRHSYGQCLTKLPAASIVLEILIIWCVVDDATLVNRLVVGLDHRLVGVRFENEIISEIEGLVGGPRGVTSGGGVRVDVEEPTGDISDSVISV